MITHKKGLPITKYLSVHKKNNTKIQPDDLSPNKIRLNYEWNICCISRFFIPLYISRWQKNCFQADTLTTPDILFYNMMHKQGIFICINY